MPRETQASAVTAVLPDASECRPAVVLASDGPLDYLLSAGLWAAGLAWLGPMMAAQMLLHRTLGPRRIQSLERLYTRGQVALTGSRWRAVVHPDIDKGRPYAFFQNHVNHLDHCTMYCATPHFKQGVELADHFRYPIYGAFMKSRGTIPVARDSVPELRALIARMRAEIEQGGSLLIFPEGTRTVTGHLGEFQPGVFRVVVQLGVPIVPVTVTGMYRVMRKGSYLIRPGHEVTTFCDAPIQTASLSRRDVPEVMARVRATMTRRLDDYWRRVPR